MGRTALYVIRAKGRPVWSLILFPLLPLADESEDLFAFIWGKPLDPAIRVEPRQLPFRVRPRVFDPQLPCGIQRQDARKIQMKFPASDTGPSRQRPLGVYSILERASSSAPASSIKSMRRANRGVNVSSGRRKPHTQHIRIPRGGVWLCHHEKVFPVAS